MNTHHKLSRNIYHVGMVVFITSFLMSCAPKIAFLSSSVVPAAEGSVKIKNDKNNNYSINVAVTSLAKPERLNPSGNIYVVWMQTEQNGTKNIGRLKTSRALLSKLYKSSLKTVTPFKPASFFITAEKVANIQQPQGETVLKTDSFNNLY
jgi:hypothetical protein